MMTDQTRIVEDTLNAVNAGRHLREKELLVIANLLLAGLDEVALNKASEFAALLCAGLVVFQKQKAANAAAEQYGEQ